MMVFFQFNDDDGNSIRPRWFRFDVDKICEHYGLYDSESIQYMIDAYKQDGDNFFEEIGKLVINAILLHCSWKDEGEPELYDMERTSKVMLKKMENSINHAYKVWEQKKINLKK